MLQLNVGLEQAGLSFQLDLSIARLHQCRHRSANAIPKKKKSILIPRIARMNHKNDFTEGNEYYGPVNILFG